MKSSTKIPSRQFFDKKNLIIILKTEDQYLSECGLSYGFPVYSGL